MAAAEATTASNLAPPEGISQTELYAAGKLIAADCAKSNEAFVRCKLSRPDPEACLAEGAGVTACVGGVVGGCRTQCAETYGAYQGCLKTRLPFATAYSECRDEERALKLCYFKVTRLDSSSGAAHAATTHHSAQHQG